jgi:hypothetical protein
MSRKIGIALLILASAVVLAVLQPIGNAVSQELQQVFVTNFPEVVHVDGAVAIKDPIRLARLASITDIIVSPVGPKDTLRMIQAGTITADGFGNVVLSLTGHVKGEILRPGTVGAILIPDEEPIARAFDERGQMQFPLEVTAPGVSGASPFFASNQPRYTVAFPRYRVLLYNTTDRTVNVSLYAYLAN